MSTDALNAAEALSAKGATAPRVSIADIENSIAEVHYVNAGMAADAYSDTSMDYTSGTHPLDLLTLCFLVCKNGFTVVGKSAPASRENFDPEKGRTFAYEDAVKQLWPLMGYALRDRLAGQ